MCWDCRDGTRTKEQEAQATIQCRQAVTAQRHRIAGAGCDVNTSRFHAAVGGVGRQRRGGPALASGSSSSENPPPPAARHLFGVLCSRQSHTETYSPSVLVRLAAGAEGPVCTVQKRPALRQPLTADNAPQSTSVTPEAAASLASVDLRDTTRSSLSCVATGFGNCADCEACAGRRQQSRIDESCALFCCAAAVTTNPSCLELPCK